MGFVRSVIVGAVAVALSSMPSHGQNNAPLVSKHRIVLGLMIADSPARVWVQNGTMARVSLAGQALGLVPRLLQANRIRVTVVELTTDPGTGDEHAQQTGEFEIELGERLQYTEGRFALEIEFVEVKPPVGEGGNAASVDSDPCTICCMYCPPDLVVCASYVEVWCGSCCCPKACSCGDEARRGRSVPSTPPSRIKK